ncbi:hydrogen peroxide-dependent heme synthase [Candidatus Rhodoluna planktonica]|uniref:Coproheme decarboxylase n=1 Tax=Candidatus Rhodoluna planktonica TaxID=535712 RepID=A0A1D9E0J5_9MICO|nr:hydrogen peroxide-dependent heme synthase [Candidatus Rhodoluna planktonica]AOY56585.1 chlorite dismutase [Candidatus Rhodoluna planktonica]
MNQSKFDAINHTIRYTNWSAFKLIETPDAGEQAANEYQDWLASLEKRDITFRGAYDIRGFRGDSELLLWLHASEAELVQQALREFSQLKFGTAFKSHWAGMGLHRPAEFNRQHVPGFMLGKEPKKWLCMYPFVRSYDWYLIPEQERREMLIEHGVAGHKYEGITSSTVAAFALGDYEWLLALESNELHEIVDMMRDLRYTKARMHVREELPFFTGRLIDTANLIKDF